MHDLNDAIEPMMGHPQTITPNLQHLSDEGINFTNAQVNSPICGPSRTSFLTGLYPHTTGYYGYNFLQDHWRNNPTLVEAVTIMEHFRSNGYHVMGTGKVFHNNQEDWTVWDEFGIPPSWGFWTWNGTPDDEFEFDLLSPWRNSVVHPNMPPSFGIDDQFGSIDDVPVLPADPENNIPGYAGWRLFINEMWNGPAAALTAVASNTPLELGEPGKKEDQFYSLRSEQYRYILCPNGEKELYNHDNDPYEWDNLTFDPEYAEIKTDLKNQLMQF